MFVEHAPSTNVVHSFFLFCFEAGSYHIVLLAWNSPCIPGYPQSVCSCLPNGSKCLYYHDLPRIGLFVFYLCSFVLF